MFKLTLKLCSGGQDHTHFIDPGLDLIVVVIEIANLARGGWFNREGRRK